MCFGFPGRPTFGSGTGEENLSSLDKEEATRRELGAELGCSDFKDRCFPGGVADTGVTQEIRGDHEGGRDVFGERHVGKATQRGCVGKG